jgi:hypothetical protein
LVFCHGVGSCEEIGFDFIGAVVCDERVVQIGICGVNFRCVRFYVGFVVDFLQKLGEGLERLLISRCGVSGFGEYGFILFNPLSTIEIGCARRNKYRNSKQSEQQERDGLEEHFRGHSLL